MVVRSEHAVTIVVAAGHANPVHVQVRCVLWLTAQQQAKSLYMLFTTPARVTLAVQGCRDMLHARSSAVASAYTRVDGFTPSGCGGCLNSIIVTSMSHCIHASMPRYCAVAADALIYYMLLLLLLSQVVLRIYSCPAEVLMGFDIDSCCGLYDGSRWASVCGIC
jgi:hypothetical protein